MQLREDVNKLRRFLLDDGNTCILLSDGTWAGKSIGETKERPANIVMKLS